jgi:hypothetical protein
MSTFFNKYIGNKIKSYTEPTRKGTTRGDPIGLSRPKFKAALLSITSLSQKEIAAAAEVSYGVYRKWRTEDLFKQEIAKLQDDFFHFLISEIREKIDKDVDEFADYKDGKTDIEPPAIIWWSEIEDRSLYGKWIIPRLRKEKKKSLRCLETVETTSDDFAKEAVFCKVLNMITNPGSAEGLSSPFDVELLILVTKDMEKMLSTKKITEKDRRKLLQMVVMLRSYISDQMPQ